MSKRNPNRVTVLSAFALTMICLLSAYAQKEPQGTASSVKPVRGIDVIVKKDPGNTAARTGTTNEKGEVEFAGLEPGNYSVTIVDSKQQKVVKGNASIAGDVLLRVEIVGAVGGPIKREWNVKESKFATLPSATARAMSAPRYDDNVKFDIGSGNPTLRVKVQMGIDGRGNNE